MRDTTIDEPRWWEQASAGSGDPPMPAFTWAQLEHQLLDLATKDNTETLVRQLVWDMRRQAHAKPPELVLREMLCLAWIALDEDVSHPL